MMKRAGSTLLLLVALTACGGSDGASPSMETSGSPTAEQIQDLAESGAVDDIADAAGVSEACVELSLAMASAAGGIVPQESGDTMLDLQSLNRSFDAIKSEAPDDLKGDIDIVKEAMGKYLSVLSEYGNDFTAMMSNPEAAEKFAAAFDDEAYAAASERFTDWINSVCTP